MKKAKYQEMGSRIRQARIDAGFKQKDCLVPLGDITPGMLSGWEKGYVCPSLNYLINISKFFNVSLDYIIMGTKKDENDMTIRTYKDCFIYIVELLKSNLLFIYDQGYAPSIFTNSS